MVLAPEHPLVEKLTAPEKKAEVEAYRRLSAAQTAVERQTTEKEKTGVFIGAYAINPVNNERIPIWIADYVMMGYGTGAIMAVPVTTTTTLSSPASSASRSSRSSANRQGGQSTVWDGSVDEADGFSGTLAEPGWPGNGWRITAGSRPFSWQWFDGDAPGGGVYAFAS